MLFDGIRAWSEYRKGLDKDEVKNRALQTLRMYREKGVQYIRSYVGVSNDLTALKELLELKDEVKKEVGIQLVAFPQGRFDPYPKRRGITRMKELLKNNINVSPGHDDLYDPFYLPGNGDIAEVLLLSLHLCHMMGYPEPNNFYRIITYNGAKTLNLKLEQYGILAGKPVNFNLFKERNFLGTAKRKRNPVFCEKRKKHK